MIDFTNSTDHQLNLQPCESYEESTFNEPHAYRGILQLNCNPVGHIAPHATVRFQMQLAIQPETPRGLQSIRWTILDSSLKDVIGSIRLEGKPISDPRMQFEGAVLQSTRTSASPS